MQRLALVVLRGDAGLQDGLLPPLLHVRQAVLVHRAVALAGIGRGDHHRAAGQPGVVQCTLVADRIEFAVGGHLAFQAQGFDVLVVMRGNVPGDQFETVAGAVDRALASERLLQVAALRLGQPGGDLVEPAGHCGLVDVQFRHALLVQQRRHGLVFHRALHRIGVQDRAEFVGGLLVLQQRGAGEGQVGRIGQRLAHAFVGFAAMAAVALVHQHDQVGRGVAALGQLGGGGELLHQREGDALVALADALGQVAAGSGLAALAVLAGGHGRAERTAADEVARQLGFQVGAVGDHQYPAFLQGRVQQQRLGQEHHGEALARTGGVPEHAALAAAIGPELAQLRQQRADAEELLVARHQLAGLAVEQHEVAQEFQQPRRGQHAGQQPVLLGGQHRLCP